MRKEYKYKVGQHVIFHIDYSDKGRCGVVIGVNPENGDYIIRWYDNEVSDNVREYLLYPIDPPKPESEIMFSLAELREVLNKMDMDGWFVNQDTIGEIIARIKGD